MKIIVYFLPSLATTPRSITFARTFEKGLVFVDFRHWQVCEVSTVAVVDQGIGDQELFV
jgi:hypothetical protein